MLNQIIKFSLQNRLLIIAAAVLLTVWGSWQVQTVPIDVFPDLNRPRVVIMTEAPGMAPEEVETLISFPIETAMNGAPGVDVVRSSSGVGISVVYVDFAWGTDIYDDRQVVAERLQLVTENLPQGVQPTMAPISSIMGQILMLGMWSDDGRTGPLPLRTQADWIVRQRLLTIQGVSQVFVMGGGRKQFQVLINPDSLLHYDVSLDEVKQAVADSNQNETGGYLDRQGPNELLVRALGRVQTVEDLEKVVVTIRDGRPVSLAQVARIVEAPQIKRGDSAAYVRTGPDSFTGGDAVVLTINKQPGADTRAVTADILKAVNELKPALSDDIIIEPLYSQRAFIDRAIENVVEALRDGTILVVIILFLFLMNLKVTFITLTAIPLSIVTTFVCFQIFGFSINTMTLGGLAVAIGELVDDAIVDVENIFRRLKENRVAANPRNSLRVVYDASLEVRSSIVFGTMIVILVFLPLFGLTGMEGKLFTPLGLAYIVSILSSLVVSLTVTPVLSYWLLAKPKKSQRSGSEGAHIKDGFLLAGLKWIARHVITFSLRFPWLNIAMTLICVGIAGSYAWNLDRDFLPPFNEGTIQLNVVLPPGTSLKTSNEINRSVEQTLRENEDVLRFARRTGRAELDEHAEGVNMSEFLLELEPDSPRSREQQLETIREAMEHIPGIVTAVEQPIAHLISHMLSGVKAQIGVKIYGDDLDELRRQAERVRAVMAAVPGVTDLLVEPQVIIPQLRIQVNRDQLLLNGLSVAQVNEFIETALNGQVVSEVLDGQRTFDLLVRLDEPYREDLETLKQLAIELPEGGHVPLSAVADIYESGGPNTINRENVRRRVVIQCNVTGRGVVDVVEQMRSDLKPVLSEFPVGYYTEFSGQFESQQSASRRLAILFSLSLFGVFLTLFTLFGSVNLSLQVLAALPMAFIGSVVALVVTGQTLTIAAMVGFISLTGIASRNGILLISHYLHLVKYEGADWSHDTIVRAGLERLAPVLMTALTSGIGLLPLVLVADEPGKEILYPVATVILGGLISSTLLDFLVHPALFWLFGRQQAEKLVASSAQEDAFLDT